MASQFFGDYFKHKVASAAITDVTPPVFGGITGLTPLGNGALSVNATPGTDALSPIRYEIYISTSNVGLFNTANICQVVTSFPANVFQNASGGLLTAQTYYVGVRAVDSVGNRDTNLGILNAASSGVSSASVAGQLTQILNVIGTPANVTVSLDLADIKKNTDLIPGAL